MCVCAAILFVPVYSDGGGRNDDDCRDDGIVLIYQFRSAILLLLLLLFNVSKNVFCTVNVFENLVVKTIYIDYYLFITVFVGAGDRRFGRLSAVRKQYLCISVISICASDEQTKANVVRVKLNLKLFFFFLSFGTVP